MIPLLNQLFFFSFSSAVNNVFLLFSFSEVIIYKFLLCEMIKSIFTINSHCPYDSSVVGWIGFYVPPTAKVIRRRDLDLKSHPKDWRSPGSNSGPLVIKWVA